MELKRRHAKDIQPMKKDQTGQKEREREREGGGGRVISMTSKLALQWLPCQAPGVKGSALELVGQYHSTVTEKESLICSFYRRVAARKVV